MEQSNLIKKALRFVAQQAIEGSHAAQLQKNTQHFFFWWPYCLLDSSMQSACQNYSMFQWWASTKLLDLGHAHTPNLKILVPYMN